MHDDLMAARPDGARHDVDICAFCVDQAQATTFGTPPGSPAPDVSEKSNEHTEGGDTPTMTDISQEAHDALLSKAVADAVATTEAALATKTTELASVSTRVSELETENASLTADVARLNKELDEAQVKLSAATEEVANIKKAADEAAEAAAKAEVASKRTDQVKNLKLFPDEYVQERAERWAELTDAAWADQLDEWSKLKPAVPEAGQVQETASAMSGSSDLTKDTATQDQAAAGDQGKSKSARRAALGLS
jgi:regulator of replication initiation timing